MSATGSARESGPSCIGLLLGLLLILSCCSLKAPDTALSALAPEDQAVYQMLALELTDFIERGYTMDNGICVAVDREPDANSDLSAVPDAVFRALEQKAAGAAKLIRYSASLCPFDNIPDAISDRALLSAYKVIRSSGDQPNWMAGITLETLYGWGHAYDITIEGSEARVKSLFAVIS